MIYYCTLYRTMCYSVWYKWTCITSIVDSETENSLKWYSSYQSILCQSVSGNVMLMDETQDAIFTETPAHCLISFWWAGITALCMNMMNCLACVWHQLSEKLPAGDFMLSLSVNCMPGFVFMVYEAPFRILFLPFKQYFLKHMHVLQWSSYK